MIALLVSVIVYPSLTSQSSARHHPSLLDWAWTPGARRSVSPCLSAKTCLCSVMGTIKRAHRLLEEALEWGMPRCECCKSERLERSGPGGARVGEAQAHSPGASMEQGETAHSPAR
jgi:hypothetical protein